MAAKRGVEPLKAGWVNKGGTNRTLQATERPPMPGAMSDVGPALPGTGTLAERNAAIYRAVKGGATLASMAKAHGISVPRVRQITDRIDRSIAWRAKHMPYPTLYPISHDALMGSSLIAGWLAEVGR